MNALQTSLINFQTYIYQPTYKCPLAERSDKTTATTLYQFLAEYPLLLVLLFLSVGSILLEELITGQNLFKLLTQRSHSSPALVFIVLPLAIIIEEKLFRSVLYLTPKRLRGIVILLLLLPFYYYVHSLEKSVNMQVVLGVIISWIVTMILMSRYVKRPAVFTRINAFWQTNFRWIFYSLTLLYAMGKIGGHLNILTTWQGIFLPVWLLSGLLSGFYFGYIRMKYGFWYAVVVHALLIATPLAIEMIVTL